MIAPKDESSDLVMQWIESEGLADFATISPRLDTVVVEASISKIEKLLNAEYSPFGGNAFFSLKSMKIADLTSNSTPGHRRCARPNS